MGHGIFPTHNHYYLATEIFPYLTKAEKKEVFFPEKKSKKQNVTHSKYVSEEDEQLLQPKKRK